MNVAPVIRRELQAQARQPVTHWLRAGEVGVMLAAMLLFALNHDFSPGAGADLLTYLHGWLFFAIWIFVPTLTADCLSRERREGTLSLLFLTHLRPFDIVLAKTTAHALRALTLWIATVPALTLPFLIGGAGWQHAVLSVLFNFMALCLALSAGVLASSSCKSWSRAMVSALCLAFAFELGFFVVNWAVVVLAAIKAAAPSGVASPWQMVFRSSVAAGGIAFATQGLQGLGNMSAFPGMQMAWLKTEGCMAVGSFAFLWLCLWLAARNVAKRWRDEPPSLFVQGLERQFCTPILGVNLLRRWLRRVLERNPVGWLERRTWSGRTMMWAWLAVVTSIYITIFSGIRFTPLTFEGLQSFIAWSLAVSLAYTAAGSFRRERETGVLELLLVSPTSSWQILSGRVRGLWGQFAPALVLLFGVWLFLFTFPGGGHSTGRLIFYATVLLTLPVIGLYFSLARRTFLAALLWTLAVGCVIPVVVQTLVALLLPGNPAAGPNPLPVLLAQGMPLLMAVFASAARSFRIAQTQPDLFDATLVVAAAVQLWNTVLYGIRLHRNLEQRKFALERSPA